MSAGFAFRWTGLNRRSLADWANPLAGPRGVGRSNVHSEQSFVEVPLATPHAALAPYVTKAATPLFVAFDGYVPPADLIESCVQKLVERRMDS